MFFFFDPGETWSLYVQQLLDESGKRESEFIRDLSVQQGTFNRWRTGRSVPDKAALVAEFARELDRNPLEAFVAAGMLSMEEAGRSLTAQERRFLSSLSPQEALAAHESEDKIREQYEGGNDSA